MPCLTWHDAPDRGCMHAVARPTRALDEVMRSIAVMEAVGRVESDLERSLRGMAAQGRAEAAARRLKLAEEAARGARAAGKLNDRLQHARRRAEQTLSRLAEIAVPASQPDRTPVASRNAGKALVEFSADPQPADIHQRLAELRRARPVIADGRPIPMSAQDLQRRAREAIRFRQEAVSQYLQAQQRTADAIRRAASARDRFAEASERSARAGVGDVAERNCEAELQQAAAAADRRPAQVVMTGPRHSPELTHAAGPPSG